MSKDKIIGISMVCTLPFLIFVKDGFKIVDKEENTDTLVDSEEEKDVGFTDAYVVVIDEKIQVGVQFCKRVNKNNDSGISIAGELKSNRYGKTGYSAVKVNFLTEQIDEKNISNILYFSELSVLAINKFIEHYRAVTKKYHINRVTSTTIQDFSLFTYYNDENVNKRTYVDTNGALHGLGGSIIEEEDSKIRNNLINDIELSITQRIQLDVWDKLDLEEYRLSVIESAILFETWLNIFLRKKFKRKGLNAADIDEKFLSDGKEPFSAYSLARKSIKEATTFDFEKTNEFNNWCTFTKNLRNDIVHGKKYAITKEEAIKSYHSAIEAINIVEDTVHNTIER